MEQNNKTSFTTVGIDLSTNRQIDKLCKRYSLKKGELVKLAFAYLEKACINPAEAPESTKIELSKINKRQDDIIRFIRNYEENELNPMIRTINSISVRFESIAKGLETLILSQLEASREKQLAVLKKLSEEFTKHADVINNQGKQIYNLYQLHQKDNAKFLKLINLYADLVTCGVIDGKRKENLRAEITNLTNS